MKKQGIQIDIDIFSYPNLPSHFYKIRSEREDIEDKRRRLLWEHYECKRLGIKPAENLCCEIALENPQPCMLPFPPFTGGWTFESKMWI